MENDEWIKGCAYIFTEFVNLYNSNQEPALKHAIGYVLEHEPALERAINVREVTTIEVTPRSNDAQES